MEHDEAVREVHDIKRIMEESRRRTPVRYPVGGLLLLAGAALAIIYMPLLAPFVAAALVLGGIVFRRQSTDQGERRLAAIAIALGLFVLVAALLMTALLLAGRASGAGDGAVDPQTAPQERPVREGL